MKILHINKSFDGGGVEKYLRELLDYFSSSHQVDALVVNDKKKTEIEQYNTSKIIKLSKTADFSSAKLSLSFPFYLNKIISEYDILHFHYPNPIGELSWLLNLSKNAKTVVTFHNDVAKEKKFANFYNKLMKLYFKRIDKIIVTSDNLAKTSNVLKNYQNKIEVIPLGIRLKKFLEQEKKEFKKINKNILFVGRLAPVKGIEYLVRAMKNVNANLNIVGKGPLKDKIEKMVKDNNLENKINLLGFVSNEDLLNLYQKADIFVLPSVYRGEGFGYVLLEAMISKTACISTELGTGTSYINQNNKTGFVVPPRDSKELADKINILIENEDKLENFKKNAFDRVKNRFSLKRMFNDIEKVYQDLLN